MRREVIRSRIALFCRNAANAMPNSAAGPTQALIQHPSFAVLSAADLCVREVRERLLAGKVAPVPAAAPPRSMADLPDELSRCVVSFLPGRVRARTRGAAAGR